MAADRAALGRLLYLGEFLEPDQERAQILLTQAAEAGESFAAWTLYQITFDWGDPVPGYEWLKRAARLGDVRAAFFAYLVSVDPRAEWPSGRPAPGPNAGALNQALSGGHVDAGRIAALLAFLDAKTKGEVAAAQRRFRRAMERSGSPVPKNLQPLPDLQELFFAQAKLSEQQFERRQRALWRGYVEAGWAYAAWALSQRGSGGEPSVLAEEDAAALRALAAETGYGPALAAEALARAKEPDWPRSHALVRKAAKQGQPQLFYGIGRELAEVWDRPIAASPWFLMAARYDHRLARTRLSKVLEESALRGQRLATGLQVNRLVKQMGIQGWSPAPNPDDWCAPFGFIFCP
ncbi:MAG: hypothetical protein ACPGOV_13165 [Magnetovibrionaceae bacterium]